MKKKLLFNLVFFVAISLPAIAQSRTSVIQRVNEIKSNNEIYLWDQFTHTDVDTAKVGAAKRLILHIESFLEGQDDVQVTVEQVLGKAGFYNIDRGNLKQCLAYIKKSDVATLVGKQSYVSVTETESGNREIEQAFVPDAFTMRIKETNDFMSVYKLLKSFQAQGEILQFGKLKDVEDYSSFDLILFNMVTQEVITLLSQEVSPGIRKNMLNGKDDSLRNYAKATTAVIWYVK